MAKSNSLGRRRRGVRGGDRAGGLGRARAPHRRREVRGGRVRGRRRMGGRPGRFRGCRDHRLRDGPDGLRDRGGIATAATRTGMPATACPSRRFPGMDRAIPGPLRAKGPRPLGTPERPPAGRERLVNHSASTRDRPAVSRPPALAPAAFDGSPWVAITSPALTCPYPGNT